MSDEETQIKKKRIGRPTLHKREPVHTVEQAWDRATERERTDAKFGLKDRLSHRGISVSNIFIVMALTGAAAVALATLCLTTGATIRSRLLVQATIPAGVGFAFVLVGIFPVWGLIPKFREDEAIEGLKRSPLGWYLEIAGRSTKQRFGLWWARMWLAAALLCLLMSLAMFCRAVWGFASTLPLVG